MFFNPKRYVKLVMGECKKSYKIEVFLLNSRELPGSQVQDATWYAQVHNKNITNPWTPVDF